MLFIIYLTFKIEKNDYRLELIKQELEEGIIIRVEVNRKLQSETKGK